MTINQSLIAELQMESASTRKMLERVPTEKNAWKPHEKSMALGNLAAHVADLPGWISMTLTTDGLDLATIDYKPMIAETAEELVAHLDKQVSGAVAALENSSPEEFHKMWTLRNGEHVIFSLPKIAVLRGSALNHIVHHRGQLSVYLRMLDVPVPGMYGPSADERMAPVETAQAN